MSCSPFDLRDYFLKELADPQRRQVEAHVKTCPPCREELERLQLTEAALFSLRDEEIPQRIAFVSDKIFEPSPWRRWLGRFLGIRRAPGVRFGCHAVRRPGGVRASLDRLPHRSCSIAPAGGDDGRDGLRDGYPAARRCRRRQSGGRESKRGRPTRPRNWWPKSDARAPAGLLLAAQEFDVCPKRAERQQCDRRLMTAAGRRRRRPMKYAALLLLTGPAFAPDRQPAARPPPRRAQALPAIQASEADRIPLAHSRRWSALRRQTRRPGTTNDPSTSSAPRAASISRLRRRLHHRSRPGRHPDHQPVPPDHHRRRRRPGPRSQDRRACPLLKKAIREMVKTWRPHLDAGFPTRSADRVAVRLDLPALGGHHRTPGQIVMQGRPPAPRMAGNIQMEEQ